MGKIAVVETFVITRYYVPYSLAAAPTTAKSKTSMGEFQKKKKKKKGGVNIQNLSQAKRKVQ